MENYEQNEKSTIMDYMADLFFDPSSLAERIIKKPKVLLPLILSTLLVVAAILIVKNMAVEHLVSSMKGVKELEMLSPEQIKEMMSSQYGIGVALSAIYPLAAVYIGGGIYYLLGKIFKSQALYKEIVSLIAFAFIITAIGTLVTSIIQILTNNITFDLSLAALAQRNLYEPPKWYYSLLTLVNPFTIWCYAVIVIGLSKLGNISRSSATVIVLIFIAIAQAVAILNAFLSASKMM